MAESSALELLASVCRLPTCAALQLNAVVLNSDHVIFCQRWSKQLAGVFVMTPNDDVTLQLLQLPRFAKSTILLHVIVAWQS